MAFTTSGQETESALFLQPRSPHGAMCYRLNDVSTHGLKAFGREMTTPPHLQSSTNTTPLIFNLPHPANDGFTFQQELKLGCAAESPQH